MGRAPCCDSTKVKRGPWSPEEDSTLKNYVETYGTGGNWIALPQKAGLKRCGKSCRLRWLNYLRPDIKHGGFTEEEDSIILTLYNTIGSRWSVMASHLQGRTDNDVKNYWNTKLKKKLMAGTTSFVSTSETTLISNNITFDSSANNSMHTINTSLPLAASTADNETNYYENIQAFPIVDSNALASMGVNNQPNIVQEMLLSDSTRFALPKLIEVQENHTNAPYGFSTTVPSPQVVSSLSPSFSLESNCASWTGNAVCQDGFFMDFAPGSSSWDILEGIDFQENYETSPKFANCAYPSFFDISNSEPSGSFHH